MSIISPFPDLEQRMSLQAAFKEILDSALELLKIPELHRDRVLTEQTVLLVSRSIRWSIRLEEESVPSKTLDFANQALYGQQGIANLIKDRLATNRAAYNRAANNRETKERAGKNGAARNGPENNGPPNSGKENISVGNNTAGGSAKP